jgi:hypothetical protein
VRERERERETGKIVHILEIEREKRETDKDCAQLRERETDKIVHISQIERENERLTKIVHS